jgi:hypothetical protein
MILYNLEIREIAEKAKMGEWPIEIGSWDMKTPYYHPRVLWKLFLNTLSITLFSSQLFTLHLDDLHGHATKSK